MGLCGIIDDIKGENYDKRIREILPVLWQEIGKKEIWEEIRRFWKIQQKEILRPNLYEQSIFDSWCEYSKKTKRPLIFSKDSRKDITSGECLCDLWENWKSRYSPQRWELSQQQFRQLNSFMSQLSYETTQEKENLYSLWETNERFRVLQQTLYKIQKIWESAMPQEQSMLRIRKLTPCECLRLQGFTDEDYQALVDIGLSNSAIYHVAGDSIITTCLGSIFLMFKEENGSHEQIINDYVENKIIERK